jgi:antitoxin component of MazEF toxin-antitoxin module
MAIDSWAELAPGCYNGYNKGSMKVRIRRVGNSLGVIIPKATLEKWRVAEGDWLEVVGHSLRPVHVQTGAHAILDELKRRLAAAVVTRFTANEIRAHALANLYRWKDNGVWVSAYDEWKTILEEGQDGELFAVMLGRDERSNRLRQSPPYVGMLPREEVERLNEEASA